MQQLQKFDVPRSRRPWKHLGEVLLALGVLSFTAIGCSSGAKSSSAPSSSYPSTIIDVAHAPGTQKGYVGALKDVKTTKCRSSNGAVNFAGTITNPEPTAQNYRVYVSVLDGATTKALVEKDTAVPAKGTAKYEGSAKVSGANVTCVLRVERTPAS